MSTINQKKLKLIILDNNYSVNASL